MKTGFYFPVLNLLQHCVTANFCHTLFQQVTNGIFRWQICYLLQLISNPEVATKKLFDNFLKFCNNSSIIASLYTDTLSIIYCFILPVCMQRITVKILKFGTPQTIAIIVLKIEKFDVTLH